jgi:hypothetical protein
MFHALSIAMSGERSDKSVANESIWETGIFKFWLGQCSECEPAVWFELLVAATLSTNAEHNIRPLNPYLPPSAYKMVTSQKIPFDFLKGQAWCGSTFANAMAYFGCNLLRCREQNDGRLQGYQLFPVDSE